MEKYDRVRFHAVGFPPKIVEPVSGIFHRKLIIAQVIHETGNILACFFDINDLNMLDYSVYSRLRLREYKVDLETICQAYDEDCLHPRLSKIQKIMASLCRLSFPLGLTEEKKLQYQAYLKGYKEGSF